MQRKTVLLTGLTGAVGSRLATELQNRGMKIFCVVRNGKARAINGFLYDIPYEQIIEGDITALGCGLSENDLIYLRRQLIDVVIHSAASVKFDNSLREEIFTVNVKGTKNVVALATSLNAKEFHYVSTAYATTNRNPYEESKAEAERIVAASKIPYSIYRLGIVVGDSVTGHTSGFDGFYGFLNGIFRIAQSIRKKREHNGNVSLPIFINCSFSSTLNLIPVDWLSSTLATFIEVVNPIGGIYFLTHHTPPRVKWVMAEGFKCIGVTDIIYNDYRNQQPEQTDRSLRVIQKAVNNGLQRYNPYVTGEEQFPLEATKKALGQMFCYAPEISSEFISKILQIAVMANFEK